MNMQTFKEYITENTQESIKKDFENAFKKHFPNGHLTITTGILGSTTMFFKTRLVGNTNDLPNRIPENDVMFNVIDLNMSKDMSKFQLSTDGLSLRVKPKVAHMAMSREKIPFRKVTGDYKKVLDAWSKTLEKMKQTVQKHKKDIYNVENIPNKYLP